MDHDPVKYICFKLTNYLLNGATFNQSCNLIKFHNDKLSEKGDVSFPIDCSVWHRFLPRERCSSHCKNVFKHNYLNGTVDDIYQRFIEYSNHWLFPLENLRIVDGRCEVFLNRCIAFKALLHRILVERNFIKFSKNPDKKLYIANADEIENVFLTSYRTNLVRQIIKNLVTLSDWELVSEPTPSVLRVAVTSSNEKGVDGFAKIRCGVVIDPLDKKSALLTYDEYKCLRSKDMQLMAMHKYGIRIREAKKFRDLIDKLGKAAVIVDLLEVKHSSPAQIIRNGCGSTKGASFILYNSARIETLLNSFNEGVNQGKYLPLPPLEEIDVTLLREEEEWQLLFNYILPFPNLITRCLSGLERGQCAPHLICKFLSGLVSLFSVYYRRVRVLMESRTHLLPIIHARIYLIKCIREVLNTALSIINISPVQCM